MELDSTQSVGQDINKAGVGVLSIVGGKKGWIETGQRGKKPIE